jgi:hypothetical protein
MIFPEELILMYKVLFLYLRNTNFKFDDRIFTDLKCYYYRLRPPVLSELTVEVRLNISSFAILLFFLEVKRSELSTKVDM